MSGFFKLVIFLAVVFVGISIAVFCGVKTKIPAEMTKQFGIEVTVGDAYLLPIGPKLVMHDVQFSQPLGYGEGDALAVGKVVVDFDGYGRDPLIMRNIVLEDVHGNATFYNNVDNFSELQQKMDKSYSKPEKDFWATPTVVQSIQLRNASLTSGTTTSELEDRNGQPIGSISDPVPLKEAVGLTIAKVLQTERQALFPVAIEGIKDKAKNAVNRAAEKIREFLSEPESQPAPTEKPAN